MKKLIASFTMVAFIVFSLSCTTIKQKRVETVDVKENGKIKILQVEKKSGEVFKFSKKQPGRIFNESITGTAVRVTERIEVDRAHVERAEKEKDGKFLIIITKDGKVYKDFIGAVTEEENRYIFNGTFKMSGSVSILLSEVEMIEVKESSPGKTVILVILSIGIPLGVLMWIGHQIATSD